VVKFLPCLLICPEKKGNCLLKVSLMTGCLHSRGQAHAVRGRSYVKDVCSEEAEGPSYVNELQAKEKKRSSLLKMTSGKRKNERRKIAKESSVRVYPKNKSS